MILGQPCEEMSTSRIREVVEAFGKAALRAKKAGFDAVEIHGAHGYLLTQFLSPFSNHRQDAYGGSEENRSRFVLEVVESVRAEVGEGYPVIIRISADELVRGGYDLEFMKRLAPRLVSAGVDAIHASVGVYSTPGNLSIASMDTDPGFNLFRARAIKEAVSVPVIGVGRINSPDIAEAALARGDADLISFGRQHLTDPDFIGKVRAGSLDDVRWCVACNQGCIERLAFEMRSAACTFNPSCGYELREMSPSGGGSRGENAAARRKRVWIVGAGPAGLSAALSASECGHEVAVFEKDDRPGGQLIPASAPPYKEAFMGWVDWAVRQLKKRGVPISLESEIKFQHLQAGTPDAVILATGSSPVAAQIPGIDMDHVFDARDTLTDKTGIAGPAVVLGAGYVGMETADFLLAHGVKVTVIEMKSHIPVGKMRAHDYWLHKRIREAGGRILCGATVKSIGPEGVVYTLNDEERIEPASMVVTAMGAEPADSLEETLRQMGTPFRTVGDARSPRRLFEAIHEGHRAGREI